MIESIDVYTWNIGYDNILSKGNELITFIRQSLFNRSVDVIVIGFQEISLASFKTIEKLLVNQLHTYRLVVKKQTCIMSSALKSSFVIGTLVFVKSTKQEYLRLISIVSDCKTLSKGFITIALNINGIHLNVINTHLPFNNDLTHFCNVFIRMLNTVRANHTTIILGDLNSRSLILDDCYKKNVKYDCDANNCILKSHISHLHQLPFMNTIRFPQSVKSTILKKPQHCGIHPINLQGKNSFLIFLKSLIVCHITITKI